MKRYNKKLLKSISTLLIFANLYGNLTLSVNAMPTKNNEPHTYITYNEDGEVIEVDMMQTTDDSKLVKSHYIGDYFFKHDFLLPGPVEFEQESIWWDLSRIKISQYITLEEQEELLELLLSNTEAFKKTILPVGDYSESIYDTYLIPTEELKGMTETEENRYMYSLIHNCELTIYEYKEYLTYMDKVKLGLMDIKDLPNPLENMQDISCDTYFPNLEAPITKKYNKLKNINKL